MVKVTPKQNVWLNASAWIAQPTYRVPPAAREQSTDFQAGSEALGEYLDWVAYLDDLARQAREGRDEEARKLVLAKLRFLHRRVLLLHEQMMQGGRSQLKAGLDALQRIVAELEQAVQELTGRQPPVVDEWPLPYRLYSREGVASEPLALSGRERRRRPRAAGNVLQLEEQQAARLVLHGVRFVMALVRDGFGMAQHPQLLQVADRVLLINQLIGPEQGSL
ncbi:MAG: hypothetical protein JO338_09115 [Aquitalea sp.]|nr:hypothetical protein [Aquitalea sp.]